MANFVRKQSVISLNCKDSEVIDVPRCFYTRWAGEDNVKEDLIILENLYPKVRKLESTFNAADLGKAFIFRDVKVRVVVWCSMEESCGSFGSFTSSTCACRIRVNTALKD
ncbi:unnamed protein product [Sphagnum tenellum]